MRTKVHVVVSTSALAAGAIYGVFGKLKTATSYCEELNSQGKKCRVWSSEIIRN